MLLFCTCCARVLFFGPLVLLFGRGSSCESCVVSTRVWVLFLERQLVTRGCWLLLCAAFFFNSNS